MAQLSKPYYRFHANNRNVICEYVYTCLIKPNRGGLIGFGIFGIVMVACGIWILIVGNIALGIIGILMGLCFAIVLFFQVNPSSPKMFDYAWLKFRHTNAERVSTIDPAYERLKLTDMSYSLPPYNRTCVEAEFTETTVRWRVTDESILKAQVQYPPSNDSLWSFECELSSFNRLITNRRCGIAVLESLSTPDWPEMDKKSGMFQAFPLLPGIILDISNMTPNEITDFTLKKILRRKPRCFSGGDESSHDDKSKC